MEHVNWCPASRPSIASRIVGPLVAVLPAFRDDEALDIDATARSTDWVVSSGMKMLWLTPGTSRYAALSDQEVFDLTRAVAEVTRGRAILIASTNQHWPVHLCRWYIARCAEWNVGIVKVVPNAAGVGNEELCYGFYRAVADGSPLPLFAYTLTPPMSASLLRRLLDLPAYVGMKNDSGDFYEHREYLWVVRQHGTPFVPMTGGSMMSFLWGHDFGARAFCSGLGMIAPKVPIEFYAHLAAGRRAEALRIVREIEEPVLAALTPFGSWQALRAALAAKGLFHSRQDRYPFRTLTAEEAERVCAALGRHGLL